MCVYVLCVYLIVVNVFSMIVAWLDISPLLFIVSRFWPQTFTLRSENQYPCLFMNLRSWREKEEVWEKDGRVVPLRDPLSILYIILFVVKYCGCGSSVDRSAASFVDVAVVSLLLLIVSISLQHLLIFQLITISLLPVTVRPLLLLFDSLVVASVDQVATVRWSYITLSCFRMFSSSPISLHSWHWDILPTSVNFNVVPPKWRIHACFKVVQHLDIIQDIFKGESTIIPELCYDEWRTPPTNYLRENIAVLQCLLLKLVYGHVYFVWIRNKGLLADQRFSLKCPKIFCFQVKCRTLYFACHRPHPFYLAALIVLHRWKTFIPLTFSMFLPTDRGFPL